MSVLSGTKYGAFSGELATRVRPYVTWYGTQNTAGNYTDITATLVFESISAYWGNGTSNPSNVNIDGNTNLGSKAFNVTAGGNSVIGQVTKRVYHNSDGTKSLSIGGSGNTNIYWGSYSFSQSYTLPTIPREATITSSADFMVGNNVGITFSNPASFWLSVECHVHNGSGWTLIKSQNFGQVSSGTMTFTTANINAIYSHIGSATSGSVILRVRTYSDSGYTTLVGSYKDRTGTWSLPARAVLSGNADLTIGNDKATSFSNTNGKYVRLEYWINGNAGWYKVRDEQVGTGTSYTFTMTSSHNDAMYERMPNVTSASALVRAYTYQNSDYTTQIRAYHDISGTVSVNQTTNKPEFTTFTVSNLDKTIDNTDKYSNVLVSSSTSTLLGADTRMIKGVSKLRAVVTSANKMVALNYATANKYRFASGSKFKEENYSADSTVNLDIDNAENSTVSVTAYDSRSLTTQVSDTTSITNNAEYVPVSLWGMELVRDNGVDSETKLVISGSYWKEYFGGGALGVQNTITAHYRFKETTVAWGVQTWNALTLTDTDGALSFNSYIDGDLGATGFDSEKSFDVEVRVYDKLTNTIVEQTLSVGTPVMDITSDGVAFGDRYDGTEGGALQLLGKSILNIMYPIGSIYTNASDSTNPATLMGFGTWEAFGAGRVMVGKASSGTFETAEATGGSETHTLTTAEMPTHTHTQNSHGHTASSNSTGSHTHGTGNETANRFNLHTSGGVGDTSARSQQASSGNYGGTARSGSVTSGGDHSHTITVNGQTATNNNAGSGSAHNNLQPYVVVYLWKRTA